MKDRIKVGYSKGYSSQNNPATLEERPVDVKTTAAEIRKQRGLPQGARLEVKSNLSAVKTTAGQQLNNSGL